jgi:pilus assembly protein CpaB
MSKIKKEGMNHMKNRTIIGIVCIILAVATMFGVAPLVNKMAAGKVSVVRVNADIAKGTAIKAEDVTVVEIGKAGLQDNAITDTKVVVGKYAVCDIKSGTNVLTSYLSDKADSADDIFRTLNGTKQAVSGTNRHRWKRQAQGQ